MTVTAGNNKCESSVVLSDFTSPFLVITALLVTKSFVFDCLLTKNILKKRNYTSLKRKTGDQLSQYCIYSQKKMK